MASGPVSRTDRPNTWLLRPALRRAQSLDSLEPSTHGPTQTLRPRLGIRPLSEAKGHPADILGPEHRLTITLQGEGARYFNPAVDIALPTTQGISAVACPPTAAATQPSDNAV